MNAFSFYIFVFSYGISLVVSHTAEYESPGDEKTCECGWKNPAQARIVGGSDAYEGEWPSTVGIDELLPDNRTRMCGGSILTEIHVLVAAKCVKHVLGNTNEYTLSNPDSMTVYFDVLLKEDAPVSKTRQVKTFHYHPKYVGQGKGHDIALIVVKKPFPFSKQVGPACFPTKSVGNKESVITMGWGYKNWVGPEPGHNSLQQMETMTKSRRKCNKACHYKVFHNAPKEEICTHSKGRSISKGDTGGPLLWYDSKLNRYVLVGVASFSVRSRYPSCNGVGAFTNPTHYRQWIFDQIERDGANPPCHAKLLIISEDKNDTLVTQVPDTS